MVWIDETRAVTPLRARAKRAARGRGYAWPRNARELARCTSNVLIRDRYEPPSSAAQGAARGGIAAELASGTLTAEEALRRHYTLIYANSGSYVETARRLGLDRRSVRCRVDSPLAKMLRGKRSR